MKKNLIKYLKKVQKLQIAALGRNVLWIDTIENEGRTAIDVAVFCNDTNENFWFHEYETEEKYRHTYDELCGLMKTLGYEL